MISLVGTGGSAWAERTAPASAPVPTGARATAPRWAAPSPAAPPPAAPAPPRAPAPRAPGPRPRIGSSRGAGPARPPPGVPSSGPGTGARNPARLPRRLQRRLRGALALHPAHRHRGGARARRARGPGDHHPDGGRRRPRGRLHGAAARRARPAVLRQHPEQLLDRRTHRAHQRDRARHRHRADLDAHLDDVGLRGRRHRHGRGRARAGVGAPGAVEHAYPRQGNYGISTTTAYELTFVLPGQGAQTIPLTSTPSAAGHAPGPRDPDPGQLRRAEPSCSTRRTTRGARLRA